jgi:hypothetical protein
MKQRLIAAMLAAGVASAAAAAEPELGLIVGRATDSQDTDIVRLTYRRPLGVDGARPRWWPQQLQFGSHIGAGLRLGEAGQTKLGVGFQHLSNAGLKQPNGGINLYLLTLSVSL